MIPSHYFYQICPSFYQQSDCTPPKCVELSEYTDSAHTKDLTVDTQVLLLDLVLISLVDMSSNWMFSYPHCRYTVPAAGSGFNQFGGHEF